MLGNEDTFDAICTLLDEHELTYRHVKHQATFTSQESAWARGEDIKVGAKSLLMKVDEDFKIFVLSAAKKLDSKLIRKNFGAKKSRFATPEELAEMTGLVPGSVPPFGEPILPFPLYLDPSVKENEKVAFNAGLLTDSIILATSDYLTVAKGDFFVFSEG